LNRIVPIEVVAPEKVIDLTLLLESKIAVSLG